MFNVEKEKVKKHKIDEEDANLVIMLGVVDRDPKMVETHTGTVYSLFNIEMERKSGVVDSIPVIVWGRDAEACERYLKKGNLVSVRGRVQSRNYQEEGKRRVSIEVRVEEVDFIRDDGLNNED